MEIKRYRYQAFDYAIQQTKQWHRLYVILEVKISGYHRFYTVITKQFYDTNPTFHKIDGGLYFHIATTTIIMDETGKS